MPRTWEDHLRIAVNAGETSLEPLIAHNLGFVDAWNGAVGMAYAAEKEGTIMTFICCYTGFLSM